MNDFSSQFDVARSEILLLRDVLLSLRAALIARDFKEVADLEYQVETHVVRLDRLSQQIGHGHSDACCVPIHNALLEVKSQALNVLQRPNELVLSHSFVNADAECISITQV